MGIVVQKYGGSSLADADAIKRVARRIVENKKAGHDVVVAVSAMGDTTDELRLRLADMLEGVDAYTFVFDPYVPEVVESRLSDDLASIAIDLENGLRHFRAGDVDEALWWWQFSYVNNWGNLAGAALNALLTVVAHDRFDTDFEENAEAVAVTDEMLEGAPGTQP